MRIVCPSCKRVLADAPDDFAPRPFCSARCKLLDLDNWLNERYRLSRPLTEEDGELEYFASEGQGPPGGERNQ